jgi:hypothetical protein
MSLTQGDVLTFCDLLAKQRGITTTFKGIAAGSAIIAGAGIAGGVVGGPIGMAIGKNSYLINIKHKLNNRCH